MAKLKEVNDKKVAQDIQIAAGMICLAFFKNDDKGTPGQPDATPPSGQPQTPPQAQQAAQGTPAQLPPGLQSLAQVLQGANDPAKAIAHAIFMAISKVRQELVKRKIPIDHRIWIMGGGVVDRVLFEIMQALVQVLHFQQAGDARFVHQVKSDLLDLMQADDDNSASIRLLQSHNLPMPKVPGGGGQPPQQQGPPQGLAAPGGNQ